MSLNKYRRMDILVLSIIAIFFEIMTKVLYVWLDEFNLILMSYTIVLSIIAMIRWGARGSIVSILGGLTSCIVFNGNIGAYASYVIGNFIGVFTCYFLFIKTIGKEKVTTNKLLLISYFIGTYAMVIFFRCIIVSFFEINTFFNSFVRYLQIEIIRQSVSVGISLVILFIAGRKGGDMLVDMKDYIYNYQDRLKLGGLKEYHESGHFNFYEPFTEQGEYDNSYLLDGGTLSQDELDELDELFKDDIQEPIYDYEDNHKKSN